jgi:hypothetical protein
MRSFLVGTLGLDLALLLALALAFRRRGSAAAARPLLVGVTAQAAHFVEELVTGFAEQFPRVLGLAPWPTAVFVGFNVGWLVLWLVAAARLARGGRAAAAGAWFFALAGMANGVAHPLLALRAGGYFPGLWTAPVVGLAGVLVWRRMWRGGGETRGQRER